MSELAQLPARLDALEARLRAEMRRLNDQTNVHMRVLHEDLKTSIAALGEGRAQRRKKS